MRLGTSTNLFAQHRLNSEKPPYIEQLRFCREAGFKVLDLGLGTTTKKPKKQEDLKAPDWEARIDALANEAAKLGVDFTQAHSPICGDFFIKGAQPDAEFTEFYNEMMRRSIIACEKLGIKWMTVHPLSDNVHTEFELDVIKNTNIEFFSPWVDLAKKHHVGIAFENMPEKADSVQVRRYCSSADELIDLVDTFNDPAVGITWDFGHAKMMYNDQPRQLRKLGKRLKATHVQDTNASRDSHLIPFVGGSVAWEDIMPCLKEIGYEGDFVFECHRFMNEVPDALRMSAAKLAYDFGMYCMDLYDKA